MKLTHIRFHTSQHKLCKPTKPENYIKLVWTYERINKGYHQTGRKKIQGKVEVFTTIENTKKIAFS